MRFPPRHLDTPRAPARSGGVLSSVGAVSSGGGGLRPSVPSIVLGALIGLLTLPVVLLVLEEVGVSN